LHLRAAASTAATVARQEARKLLQLCCLAWHNASRLGYRPLALGCVDTIDRSIGSRLQVAENLLVACR